MTLFVEVSPVTNESVEDLYLSLSGQYSNYPNFLNQLNAWVDQSNADSITKQQIKDSLSINTPLYDFMNASSSTIAEGALSAYAVQSQLLVSGNQYLRHVSPAATASVAVSPVYTTAASAMSILATSMAVSIAGYKIYNSSSPITETVKQGIMFSTAIAVGEVLYLSAAAVGIAAGLPAALLAGSLTVALTGGLLFALDNNWDSIVNEALQLKTDGVNIDEAIEILMDNNRQDMIDDFNDTNAVELPDHYQNLMNFITGEIPATTH